VYVDVPPVIRLSLGCPNVELGGAVRRCLQKSRTGVPHPKEWKPVQRRWLDACNVRSYGELIKGAKLCLVSGCDTGFEITPTVNGGTRGDDRGFCEIEDARVSVPLDVTDEALGNALRRCMDVGE
jgi:hypothetical protein